MKVGQRMSSEHGQKEKSCSAQIDYLNNLVAVKPECARHQAELGILYYQSGNYESSLTHLEKAAQLEPENAEFHRCLGDLYYSVLSRNQDGLAEYLRVLELDPFNGDVIFIAANMLVEMHRFEEAEKLYRNLMSIEPWRSDVQEIIDRLEQRHLGSTSEKTENPYEQVQRLVEESRPEDAIRLLEKMLKEEPLNAVANNDLGVLKYQTGDISGAGELYKKAVSLDGTNPVYKKNLAEYYLFVSGNFEKALELYLEILKQSPDDIDALLAAGDIALRFNRIEDSKLFYSAALDVEPWNSTAFERLSDLDAQSEVQGHISADMDRGC